jgi:hypothetical protein
LDDGVRSEHSLSVTDRRWREVSVLRPARQAGSSAVTLTALRPQSSELRREGFFPTGSTMTLPFAE